MFDETNSFVKNDAHDEEYELGLIRKHLWLTRNFMHDKGKSPEGEPGPGADTLEGGQNLDQLGGKPCQTVFGTKPAHFSSNRLENRLGNAPEQV